MFAKIVAGVVMQYPYTEHQIRADFPGTSFPSDLSLADLREFGIEKVLPNQAPDNLNFGDIAEEYFVKDENENWLQNWSVRSGTSEELTAAKNRKYDNVKNKRTEVFRGGAVVPGIGTFQTDLSSMVNIYEAATGAAIATITSQPYSVSFTLANNSQVTLNAVQMMAVGKFIGERKAAIHSHSQTLRGEILSAADFDDLDSINTGQGWPT